MSLDSFLSDYGFFEEVDGEEIVTIRMGCLYTRWDEIGSVSSEKFIEEESYKRIVAET